MRNFASVLSKFNNKGEILFSEKQYAELLDSLSLLAICTDKTGKITYCNSTFCTLLNTTKDKIIGQDIRSIFKDFSTTNQSANSNPLSNNSETQLILISQNQELIISWSNTMIYNKDNELIGINSLGYDITDAQKTVNELQSIIEHNTQLIQNQEETISKLEESEHIKSLFLSNLGHEIRTPINGIVGFSELLKEAFMDEEKRERYIENIQQTSTKLLYVLNDILDTSKLNTGHIKVNFDEVNLNELLDHLSQIYKLNNKNEAVQLIVKKGLPDTYAKMIFDETHIYQTLNMLLHNAFTYTESGIIELGYELKDDQIHLYVKDTGCGMDKHTLEHLFDDNSTDIEHNILIDEGQITLPIIKKRLEMMNGDIQVISHVNEGTSVYVSIPHNIAQPTKNKVKKEKPSSAIYSDKLVLLVEDDLFSISIMKEIFDSLNLPIIHTTSGLDAIKICEENKNINLVLMDIRLPDILGTEATMHIKKIRPELPVIAQTANATTEDKELCLNAGCDNYITKPIHIGTLKSLLYKYLIEQP
jgi:PAS domain S-box-containing protein